MSDTKLRALERRWKETGTVEDETAYLQERVRAGTLSQETLERAARCGHAAAILVAGVRGPETATSSARPWTNWITGPRYAQRLQLLS
jgi:hypothetical protein